MITDSDGLRSFAAKRAEAVPTQWKRRIMSPPELDEDALRRLTERLPQIPPMYGKCLTVLRVLGVQLGHFSLWPGGSPSGRTIADDVVEQNVASVPRHLAGLLRREGLVLVASYESDPIAVGGRGCPRGEDVVFQIEMLNPANPQLRRLARDFEQFVLAVANLASVKSDMREGADVSATARVFMECLRALDFSDEEVGNWQIIAEVTLS